MEFKSNLEYRKYMSTKSHISYEDQTHPELFVPKHAPIRMPRFFTSVYDRDTNNSDLKTELLNKEVETADKLTKVYITTPKTQYLQKQNSMNWTMF
jgi:hypothetical protein